MLIINSWLLKHLLIRCGLFSTEQIFTSCRGEWVTPLFQTQMALTAQGDGQFTTWVSQFNFIISFCSLVDKLAQQLFLFIYHFNCMYVIVDINIHLQTLHHNHCLKSQPLIKFSSPTALEVVRMTTSSAVSDENSIKINFHHWLHWNLSKWQLTVQPVIKIS